MLKKNIYKKTILALPYFDKVFQVETYASGTTVGVVLSQEKRPMAHFSEKMNEAKKNTLHMIKNYMLFCRFLRNGDII